MWSGFNLICGRCGSCCRVVVVRIMIVVGVIAEVGVLLAVVDEVVVVLVE